MNITLAFTQKTLTFIAAETFLQNQFSLPLRIGYHYLDNSLTA
ncbi:DEHA2D19206p [Debaryomyces hansenii CBS767]|uniref:DEHA2D19206p n=1 Tax=Debaryomyces hansenii (strain ATCC 36239 / CBS 767 / BCRC 21394 / JCM 1990 / NBRC 0083 / IGC 2968) TaxID=284592 RepID=B5RTN6_DEBHA|nr:DEHA2D19206p [Debaryomyces hansenii CBS767]CAR65721.1 DEHA2D19206p [Debaryomyces hansenii CBS767]|eukprot:XP_002770367.1 DEHA2D19206p [Debaryomyces hansenii CBS767]